LAASFGLVVTIKKHAVQNLSRSGVSSFFVGYAELAVSAFNAASFFFLCFHR